MNFQIPGLEVFELAVNQDERGWFKENWKSTFTQSVSRDFVPIQNNVSMNVSRGVTRGFHAEPWDKYVSVASGRVFGAWVDLREGPSFGATDWLEVSPNQAVFVPAGVANAFQALEENTAYVYLVNSFWSPDEKYAFLSLFDESVAVPWPIPLASAVISEKDRRPSTLTDVKPFSASEVFIVGSEGQLGKALQQVFPGSLSLDKQRYDLSDTHSSLPASDLKPAWVLNSAAFTKVDLAETEQGRADSWAANASGLIGLVQQCRSIGAGLVHYSTDYVFDGQKSGGYSETDSLSPLSAYGQSKAAGELVAQTLSRHYVIRTTWVVGEGRNFVNTMRDRALSGQEVRVVDDQRGRLTFASDLALATKKLIDSKSEFGLYNITNSGPVASWFEIAKEIYSIVGADTSLVHPVSTDSFLATNPQAAPRPANSELVLTKFEAATGWQLPDWRESLRHYLELRADLAL